MIYDTGQENQRCGVLFFIRQKHNFFQFSFSSAKHSFLTCCVVGHKTRYFSLKQNKDLLLIWIIIILVLKDEVQVCVGVNMKTLT